MFYTDIRHADTIVNVSLPHLTQEFEIENIGGWKRHACSKKWLRYYCWIIADENGNDLGAGPRSSRGKEHLFRATSAMATSRIAKFSAKHVAGNAGKSTISVSKCRRDLCASKS